MEYDKEYWDKLYKEGEMRWDIGYIATPIKEYIDQLKDKDIRILIPGSGSSYEAEYLFNSGFRNVFVIDWSRTALQNFKERLPDFPGANLINEDFFAYKGAYDLILEQTFFCAIELNMRQPYADKVHELLNNGGKLVGLLFNDQFNIDKPPYGGTKDEYLNIFKDKFEMKVFETSYNSIKPRAGREIFINLVRKEA